MSMMVPVSQGANNDEAKVEIMVNVSQAASNDEAKEPMMFPISQGANNYESQRVSNMVDASQGAKDGSCDPMTRANSSIMFHVSR